MYNYSNFNLARMENVNNYKNLQDSTSTLYMYNKNEALQIDVHVDIIM